MFRKTHTRSSISKFAKLPKCGLLTQLLAGKTGNLVIRFFFQTGKAQGPWVQHRVNVENTGNFPNFPKNSVFFL